jgi:hypothetical protein
MGLLILPRGINQITPVTIVMAMLILPRGINQITPVTIVPPLVPLIIPIILAIVNRPPLEVLKLNPISRLHLRVISLLENTSKS